jgi:serine/threonine protein kinase
VQAIKIVKRSNPKDKIKLLRRNYQQTDGSTKQALNSTENSIRREIAVMKHLRHPNLASLLEVIDDPREEKIYLSKIYNAPQYFRNLTLERQSWSISQVVPWNGQTLLTIRPY